MKSKKNGFGWVKRIGIIPLIMVPVCIALTLFMFFYGYRLNPFDGITWDDYNQGTTINPPIPPKKTSN